MTSNSNSKMESFSEKFLSKVLEIKSSGKFCDIVVKVGDRTFQAHRLVLAASILYFYELFSAEEGQSGKKIEIVMKEVDPEVMEALINFCYSGEIQINDQNVSKIFKCAKILDVAEIKEKCFKFLTPKLDSQNVLKFKKEAQLNDCQTLVSNANEFIFNHFNEISDSEAFLEMSLEELLEILGSDQLKVSSEEVVYKAAMKWVKFDEEKRQQFLPQILRRVRLTLLPINFLMTVVSKEKLIMSSIESSNLIGRVSMYHLSDNKEEFLPGCSTVPRLKDEFQVKKYSEKIYAVFGRNIWIYKQARWLRIAEFCLGKDWGYSSKLVSSSGIALNGKIYAYYKYITHQNNTILECTHTSFNVFDIKNPKRTKIVSTKVRESSVCNV